MAGDKKVEGAITSEVVLTDVMDGSSMQKDYLVLFTSENAFEVHAILYMGDEGELPSKAYYCPVTSREAADLTEFIATADLFAQV
jgi:hypothetical protein